MAAAPVMRPPVFLQAVGHGEGVVAGPLPLFVNTGEHQTLRNPLTIQDDTEHDDRVARINRLSREVQKIRSIAPLEDPDEHAEGG